jgi:non-homologous end joining protein Ku
MTKKWEPAKYKDQYQTAAMETIEDKAQKRSKPVSSANPQPASKNIDVVAVLQQSLKRAEARKKPANSNGSRSTGTLVKQRRTSSAA